MMTSVCRHNYPPISHQSLSSPMTPTHLDDFSQFHGSDNNGVDQSRSANPAALSASKQISAGPQDYYPNDINELDMAEPDYNDVNEHHNAPNLNGLVSETHGQIIGSGNDGGNDNKYNYEDDRKSDCSSDDNELYDAMYQKRQDTETPM